MSVCGDETRREPPAWETKHLLRSKRVSARRCKEKKRKERESQTHGHTHRRTPPSPLVFNEIVPAAVV